MKKVSFSQRTYYVGQTSASSCLIRASLHLSTQVRLCILTTYFILQHTYQVYVLPTFLLRAAILNIIFPKSRFFSPYVRYNIHILFLNFLSICIQHRILYIVATLVSYTLCIDGKEAAAGR